VQRGSLLGFLIGLALIVVGSEDLWDPEPGDRVLGVAVIVLGAALLVATGWPRRAAPVEDRPDVIWVGSLPSGWSPPRVVPDPGADVSQRALEWAAPAIAYVAFARATYGRRRLSPGTVVQGEEVRVEIVSPDRFRAPFRLGEPREIQGSWGPDDRAFYVTEVTGFPR
jgi:hypothetical protein